MSGNSRILKNLEVVLERIGRAAERAGRKAEEVSLVAVTKEASEEEVRAVLESGLVSKVGENRVQNLLSRIQIFAEYGAEIHLIGRLQTNKVKKIIGVVDLIHSLDRLELLEEISKRSLQRQVVTDVLIEVNASGEETKTGVKPEEVLAIAEKVINTPGVRLRGLMMMAPFIPAEECRPFFRKTAEVFDKLKSSINLPEINLLSMGMSNDFEVAIEEGANLVRIGSAIFKEK